MHAAGHHDLTSSSGALSRIQNLGVLYLGTCSSVFKVPLPGFQLQRSTPSLECSSAGTGHTTGPRSKATGDMGAELPNPPM